MRVLDALFGSLVNIDRNSLIARLSMENVGTQIVDVYARVARR